MKRLYNKGGMNAKACKRTVTAKMNKAIESQRQE